MSTRHRGGERPECPLHRKGASGTEREDTSRGRRDEEVGLGGGREEVGMT